MSKNFYYGFELDEDSNRLLLKVNDAEISFSYFKSENFIPDIKPTDYGYRLLIKNFYLDVDLELQLHESTIKETLFLKSSRVPEKIEIGLEHSNCEVLKDSDGKYKIIGQNNVELIVLDNLEVVYEKHNEILDLNSAVKMTITNHDPKRIIYEFDKKRFSNAYPIKIDPTMHINKSKIQNYSIARQGIDNFNLMFVTAQGIDFLAERTANDYVSDDVLFGNSLKIVYPFGSAIVSNTVDIVENKLNQDTVFKFSQSFSSMQHSGSSTYVEMDIPFNENLQLKADSIVKNNPDSYGDFTLRYIRDFTMINKVPIDFGNHENYILKDSSGRVGYSLPASFKPYKFFFIPFYYSGLTNENLDVKFFVPDFTYEGNSQYLINFKFPFSMSNYPELTSRAKSFVNDAEVVLCSAINSRNNLQSNKRFKTRYKMIDPDDFVFSINEQDGAVSGDRIYTFFEKARFILKQKASVFYQVENGGTLGDFSAISRNTGGHECDHTVLQLNPIFTQSLSGSYNPYSFSNISNNGLFADSYLVGQIGDNAFAFKIQDSNENQLIFLGDQSSKLKKISKFSIVHYLPNKVYFDPESPNFDSADYDATPSSVDSNGDIIFNDLAFNISRYHFTKIFASIKSNQSKFIGIKKYVNVGNADTVEYVGTKIERVSVKVLAAKTSDSEKIEIPAGITDKYSFSVPKIYAGYILYLYVTTPESAEKVNASIELKNGAVAVVSQSDSEDRYNFVLEINQNNYDYSLITLSYLPE